MDYKNVLESLSVLRKFHTSNHKHDRIIFYRGKDNTDGLLEIAINDDDEVKQYRISLIELMSFSSKDGILIHYKSYEDREWYPFRLDDIKCLRVKF